MTRERGLVAVLTYRCGVALLAAKVVLVVAGLRMSAHVWSDGAAHVVWLAGKVVPVLIAPVFLVEAYLRPRGLLLKWFWAVLTLVVPIFAALVVMREMHR